MRNAEFGMRIAAECFGEIVEISWKHAMRTDICAREDLDAQTALLEALGSAGAAPEDDLPDVPLPTGVLRFRAGHEVLTVFTDAWGVDLEGPDALVKRVMAEMAAP